MWCIICRLTERSEYSSLTCMPTCTNIGQRNSSDNLKIKYTWLFKDFNYNNFSIYLIWYIQILMPKPYPFYTTLSLQYRVFPLDFKGEYNGRVWPFPGLNINFQISWKKLLLMIPSNGLRWNKIAHIVICYRGRGDQGTIWLDTVYSCCLHICPAWTPRRGRMQTVLVILISYKTTTLKTILLLSQTILFQATLLTGSAVT